MKGGGKFMRKKVALILTTCLLLTLLMAAFVACNNTITLRIMTKEIELIGKSFDEITVEADGPIPYSIKEIYVKVS